MSRPAYNIERLAIPPSDADITALAHLLVETVQAGDVVSFVMPLTIEEAEAYWRRTTASAHNRAVFLVARDHEGIAGTVQMQPAWAPNQPDRAEIVKLMVGRRARRQGLGRRLMCDIELAALDAGVRLLTLDAKAGEAAERLYRRMGWTFVGTIPRFALDPDAVSLHDAVIFYKELRSAS
ncbi:MAG TPA: GNAT family N-acetyltransferase [Phycisphaerae bacterium]|nr:GNAT family N-acetyltransferase [Phycisphaerae bacterium]HRW53871.1 GNAT family N-acetyltransferase [Phycisphaerae bacterium]